MTGREAGRPMPGTSRTWTVPPNGAVVGYEAELWPRAHALRGFMDAAEYKHVVLGLIFLQHISHSFEVHRKGLREEPSVDPGDPDEYRAAGVFRVPPGAPWDRLRPSARQPTMGQMVDEAMEAVEQHIPALKGVLPKDFARPALDKQRLGELVDLITNVPVGNAEARARAVLGRVYEYFRGQFASRKGKKGGKFYTPRCGVHFQSRKSGPYRHQSQYWLLPTDKGKQLP